jgi:hypothetical protein
MDKRRQVAADRALVEVRVYAGQAHAVASSLAAV